MIKQTNNVKFEWELKINGGLVDSVPGFYLPIALEERYISTLKDNPDDVVTLEQVTYRQYVIDNK